MGQGDDKVTNDNAPKKVSHKNDFIAGFLGGGASVLVGHPFDTIKVLQQTATSSSVRPSVIQCAKNTLRYEGLLGFFKGMSFPLISASGLNSIYFGAYSITLKGINTYRYGDPHAKASYLDIFIAGGVGGGVAGIPLTFIDLIKVKLQAQTAKALYRHPFHCVQEIYSTQGFQGCFRGLSATITREIPSCSIYIGCFRYFCDLIMGEKHVEPSLPCSLFAGGTAGVISWIINIPIDVIKSRLQADSLTKPKYSGFFDCAIKIQQQDGMRAFWRGLPVCCLRAFPVNAVLLSVYDKSLNFLERNGY